MKKGFFKNISMIELTKFKDDILKKKIQLSDEDLYNILSINDEESLNKLFWVACEIKNYFFKNKIFLYGFIYFSTYCKNNCSFCYYCSKNDIKRYRITSNELINICNNLKEKNLHLIDLTMGEDQYFYNNIEELIKYINIVKKITNKKIMLSPGVLNINAIKKLKDFDIQFLALYQETYDIKLFHLLRPKQSFFKRLFLRKYAKKIGFLIEDGILTGLLDNEKEDIPIIIKSIKEMKKQKLDQVRVMTFEPQKGTVFEYKKRKSDLLELKTISLLRILFPDILIPASLDIDGINGIKKRILAGANVVTSIIQKNNFLEGVVNFDRDIDFQKRERDVSSVVNSIMDIGMIPASEEDFENYINRRKNKS